MLRGARADRGDDGRAARRGRLRAVAVRAPALLPDRLPAPRSRRAAPPVPFTRFMPPRDALRVPLRPPLPRADAAPRGARCATRSIGCGSRATTRGRAHAARCSSGCSTAMFPPDRAISRAPRRCASASARSRRSTSTRTWTRRPSTSSASSQCCDSNCYADGTHASRSATTTCCTARRRQRFMTSRAAWNERSGGRRAFPLPMRRDGPAWADDWLAGKRCLITGGSRGLGPGDRAWRSRAAGARVAFTYSDERRRRRGGAARRSRRAGGERRSCFKGSVADAAHVAGHGRRRSAPAWGGDRRARQQRRRSPRSCRSRCSRRRTGTR